MFFLFESCTTSEAFICHVGFLFGSSQLQAEYNAFFNVEIVPLNLLPFDAAILELSGKSIEIFFVRPFLKPLSTSA